MIGFFSRIKSAFKAVYHLGATDRISWQDRRQVVGRLLLGSAGERPKEVRIPLGQGVLAFDATHDPDWRVYRGVFVKKEYNTDYTDSVVVDVGAHRGIFAAFALLEGCFAVLAYEPGMDNIAFLKKNTERLAGRAQQVHVYQQTVGSERGTKTLFSYDQSWSHSLMERPDMTPVSKTEIRQVDFKSVLEQAVQLAGDKRRVIVKIDAEGAEYDILESSPPDALESIDELFVEVHTYAAEDPNQLARHLAKSGLVREGQHKISLTEHEVLYFTRERSRPKSP